MLKYASGEVLRVVIDRKRPERRLNKLVRQAREYVTRIEREGWLAEPRRKIASDIAANDPLVMADLGLLATYISAQGCVRVLDGDPGGFADLDIGCLFNFWDYRLSTLASDHDPPGEDPWRGLTMDGISTCWVHAEALGARDLRAWLDTLILRVDAGYRGVSGKKMNPLCTLVAHFVTGKDAATLEAEGWAPIGIYEPIVAGTFEASQWDALCDWHLANVDSGTYPPFQSSPYRLVPFELMAISRRTGIPLSGEHPLLQTPLAVMREVPEIPVPDELQAVIDCARRVYGEI